MITIAIPKGRVLEDFASKIKHRTWKTEALLRSSRKLVRDDIAEGVRLLLLKPDDVPTYVEYGAADLGIVGRDVLGEHEHMLYVLSTLDIGHCRMCVAGKSRQALKNVPLRVATKYRRAATQFFLSAGIQADIIDVKGSVELAPVTGLAHVIVDLVDTGQTLEQNGLEVLEEISPVSSVLIANRVNLKLKLEKLEPVINVLNQLALA